MEMKLAGCLYNYCLTCIIIFQFLHEFLWVRSIYFVVLLLGKLYDHGYTVPHYCWSPLVIWSFISAVQSKGCLEKQQPSALQWLHRSEFCLTFSWHRCSNSLCVMIRTPHLLWQAHQTDKTSGIFSGFTRLEQMVYWQVTEECSNPIFLHSQSLECCHINKNEKTINQ